MLEVKLPEQVLALLQNEFSKIENRTEEVLPCNALGRVLGRDIIAAEYVPNFDRSTVDGYAIRASDSFGCSDAIPAILPLAGEILMGQKADKPLMPGTCWAVPTGGAIPEGADCVIMMEDTEDYGDGTIGICKSGAPGMNIIFRGDDVFPGKTLLKQGCVISSQDIGALAAMGITSVGVVKKLTVGVLSTGDELIPPESTPGPGQVRDVNGPMLHAMLTGFGAEVISYGIVPDDERKLADAVDVAAANCDAVLISGGSSVGERDAACRVIEGKGELLLHGIAIKPGKPTILGRFGNIPLVGLPGHPVAAYFVTKLFVFPLLSTLMGKKQEVYTVTARLTESVSANHGRAQYSCVHLFEEDGRYCAQPIRSKSGLITTLAGADGYFCIGRDCEGIPKGGEIQVTICTGA